MECLYYSTRSTCTTSAVHPYISVWALPRYVVEVIHILGHQLTLNIILPAMVQSVWGSNYQCSLCHVRASHHTPWVGMIVLPLGEGHDGGCDPLRRGMVEATPWDGVVSRSYHQGYRVMNPSPQYSCHGLTQVHSIVSLTSTILKYLLPVVQKES